MAKAKAAVVTGSTSGIGLAIARALAREGTNVMLNGFGDAGEIEKTRAEVERQCGVRALYCPADMSKPAEIAEMIRTEVLDEDDCQIRAVEDYRLVFNSARKPGPAWR